MHFSSTHLYTIKQIDIKKRLIYFAALFTCLATKAQTVKITTCEQKRWTDAKGYWQVGIGKPQTNFEGKLGQGAEVYFQYDISNNQSWGNAHPLEFVVYQLKGDEQVVSYYYAFSGNSKPAKGFTNTGFTPGSYVAVFKDKGGDEKIYSKTTFTVKSKDLVAELASVRGTLTVCKEVDDNWNALGAATTFKAGECVNFMVKLPQKIASIDNAGWEIFRVLPDGTQSYFNELSMILQAKNTTKWATTFCIADFGVPGKYRIYAIDWKDRSAAAHTGEFSNYFAKTDITVE